MEYLGHTDTGSWSKDDCYNSRHPTMVLSMKKVTEAKKSGSSILRVKGIFFIS